MGPPVGCCCVKLVDVPDMEYYASKGQGEVCVQGSNVFIGYYKDPEKTKEVIDVQGWHHTGDIGMWLPVSYRKFWLIKVTPLVILGVFVFNFLFLEWNVKNYWQEKAYIQTVSGRIYSTRKNRKCLYPFTICATAFCSWWIVEGKMIYMYHCSYRFHNSN